MSTHLTEEQLLHHQFKLADGLEAQALESHLAGCADCRARLADQERKFQTLELLRDDVPAPAELIAKVVRQARPVRMMMVPFWHKALWAVAAAAALIMVGVIGPWHQAPKVVPGVVQNVAPRVPAVEAPAAKGATMPAQDDPELAELRARDPFLPGSNIELNVLPTRENVQLTIYNSADLTLVRERRTLTMKKGWNWLQFMWANTLIDPTSLQLEPTKPEHKGKVVVQTLVFPPRIRELGRWLLFSEVSGPVPVEITYLTSGLSWRAFYMGTLAKNEMTMKLQGYVRASNNSGEDYAEAQTRLIVGKVNLLDQIAELARREHAYGEPRGIGAVDSDVGYVVKSLHVDKFQLAGRRRNFSCRAPEPKQIIKEGLSEYFLYTIEGRETIENGWAKRLPSFEAQDIPVVCLYKYDEEQWGAVPVRFVSFKNDAAHKLGETPIPDGNVRIYHQVDAEQHLAYVGAADIKYVPVDGDIELNLGAAQQVTVEATVMKFQSENHLFDKQGNVDGWDEARTWRLKIANTREIPAKLEITRNFGSAKWELMTDEPGYRKYDMSHGRFTLELPPFSGKEIVYTLRTYHGRRQ